MKDNMNKCSLPVVLLSIFLTTVGEAAEIPLNGSGWTCDGEAVSVPHTWNAQDGADGLDVPKGQSGHNSATSLSYVRTVKTYRRALPAPKTEKRYFIRFGGACEKAAVRVNGREVGRHVGAFAGFVFEITEALRPADNVLEVEVDNRVDRSVPPYEGDFTMFGGLYRDVTLIEKPLVCIDPRVPIAVTTDPKTGHAEVTYAICGKGEERKAFDYGKPELWSPENPKLYEATVRAGEDAETVRFGFRTAEVRADGFYLNGVKRQLRGVCLHQDHGAKGWAASAADEEADVRALKELGADAVRTSHYPRSPRFYDLCDRYGVLVWTEVPLVDEVPGTNAVFEANALAMAEEMVTQHRNHPSIFAWGVFNEVYQFRRPDGSSEKVLRKIRDRIHSLDPSRPTGGASNGKKIELNAVPDILGMNLYPGWYGTSVDMMDTFIEDACRDNKRSCVALTEFGAGGSVKQHDDAKVRPVPASFWHPEEYQAYFHARAYRYMKGNPRVWGTFAWQMFDAASDSRQEGDHAGINDKGLVMRDRQTKKDAWWLYHANWTKEPVLHIVGQRWGKTDKKEINVLTFCNVGTAKLTVNGRRFDVRDPDPAQVIFWEEVPLKVGMNEIVLTAGGLSRTLTIEREPALAPFPKWGEPQRVTSGPHEHFLANYFAIDAWSPNKRYMLVLETDLNGRLPEANERCTLGLVDRADGNRFIPITTTACWNFQEAAMAHWISDDEFLYNDVRDGKFKTVILNWKTKRERVLPMPVSAVSEDRTWAVSLNYARLSLTRPDYGYAGPGQDPREDVEWPADDGLWTMDLRTGETKLILSVADTRAQMVPQPTVMPDKPGHPLAYHCHTVISKDGEKIFILARSTDWFDKVEHTSAWFQTTCFTVDRDGKNLCRCFKDNWQGSHFNWAPDGSHRMLVTAVWDGDKRGHWLKNHWSLVEFTVGEEEKVRRIGAGTLDMDWHCVHSPDGLFMSGETYWNKYFERPWVLVRLQDGMTMPMGVFYVPEAYRGGYWRCDLHARFRKDGREIAFNSVHEGSRQVYVREIEPAR